MRIGLVGWGVETQNAYRYFGDHHEYIIGNEEPRDDFPEGPNVTVHALPDKRPPGLAGNVANLSYLDHYDDCDLVIYQGATLKNLERKFPADHPFWAKAKSILHIFFEESPTRNIIGVTGTKGKGTTTTLTAKLVAAGGFDVQVGGNIGIGVLDLLPHLQKDSWVVLELSNFQLYKFPYSPHIAVHLMMTREHVDEWHKTMEDYVAAKRNIFAHQSSDDVAIFYPKNQYSATNAEASAGTHIPYGEAPGAFVDTQGLLRIDDAIICRREEFGLLGAHNEQNICAAVTAAWQVHHDSSAMAAVVREFSGLEHRLELIRELDGVRYYDDSFGTTPDTAIVAMDAFTAPKVMIIGGHDKGNPFDDLAARLGAADIRHVIFIGTTARVLYDLALQAGLLADRATVRDDGNSWTMPEIVATARQKATTGDVVLLSTGCASFGLFKDYKDRGNQFRQCVNAL